MAAKQKTRDLGRLDFTRMGRGINVYNPTPGQIVGLLRDADGAIGGLTTEERVLEIYEHNPDSIFVISRSNAGMENPEGFLAQLPLNAEIYSWCIYVNPRIAGGISLIFERFSSPKNKQAPIYCRAANENARQFFLSIGFKFNPSYQGISVADLMGYERPVEESIQVAKQDSVKSSATQINAPAYDNFEASSLEGCPDQLGVGVVHSISELMEVTAIRAATYMAEHGCPYDEEFDGNDFSCTHLLGRVGASPAGCLRIRFFSSFAKIERLAVIKSARRTRLADELIKAAIQLCRKKGYRDIYGHSDEKIIPLWKKHGFKPRSDKATFSFSGLKLVEGDLKLNRANDVIDLQTDPMIINRPEGQWHRPGALEN